jgi:phenylpropionate dioxygenase-like ring-hydroxylating dioxygenase large terminal subunit
MRLSDHPALRRFWYMLTPMTTLGERPVAARLLGEDIVLWRGVDGAPAAARDRCRHRSARLSGGWVDAGCVVCPYHGWAYDASGACVRVPQLAGGRTVNAPIETFRCAERFGYVWVCLDEPLFDIPEIPEFGAPGIRQVQEFDEIWDVMPLRIIENDFDMAHLTYVHRASFGPRDPVPPRVDLEETEDGFIARYAVPVRNPEVQKANLRMNAEETMRRSTNRYFMPFFRSGRIDYPNGLVHVLVTACTPVDDNRTRFVQFVLRSDSEEDAPTEQVRAFDRQVTEEDRYILEGTGPDVPLSPQDPAQVHIVSDRPGLLMRRKLDAVFAEHGETTAADELSAA